MPRETKEIDKIKEEIVVKAKSGNENASKKSSSSIKKSSKLDTSKKPTNKVNVKSKNEKTNTNSDSKHINNNSKTITTKKSKTSTKTSKTSKSTSTKKKSSTSTKKVVSKNAVKNTSHKINVVEYYDLPYRYNQTFVKVLAQTPNNLFIYWDISDKDLEKYKKQYGKNFFKNTKPILIVHNNTLNYSFEVEINDFANSWYLQIDDAKCNYSVELGRRPIVKNEVYENIDYIYVSTSNNMEAPNNHILFDKTIKNKSVLFRNIKTGNETINNIDISTPILKNMGELYNIYDLYKSIYKDENIEELYDLSNPSSSNPSSGHFRFNNN